MVRKRQVWDLCSIYEMFSPLLPIVLYKAGLLVSAYLDFFFFVFFLVLKDICLRWFAYALATVLWRERGKK